MGAFEYECTCSLMIKLLTCVHGHRDMEMK